MAFRSMQYESIEILLGNLTEADEPFESQQLSFSDANPSFPYNSFFFFQMQKRPGGLILRAVSGLIIPYQELPGNYNAPRMPLKTKLIIPYQELPGNYNFASAPPCWALIIP